MRPVTSKYSSGDNKNVIIAAHSAELEREGAWPLPGSASVIRRHYVDLYGHCTTFIGIAPPSEGTSLQKRSGMARVVEGFHSFTCTPTRLFTNGMNHSCLCFPSRSWSSFTDSGGMEG